MAVDGSPHTGPAYVLSPYVGLSYYTEADAEWFFGRDGECQTIVGNLRAARLTIFYAPSGVGKSSLLRAGVAQQLGELARRRRAERGAARFLPVVFGAWKDEPVEELIDTIWAAVDPFLEQQARHDRPATEELQDAIEAASEAADARLLIILDQFEEYFLYAKRESHPGRFADELARCVNRDGLRANFLIAIREDAYAGVGDMFAGKIANVYGNHLTLEHLNDHAARDAILRPLEHFNAINPEHRAVEVQPALVDAVLEQVRTGEVLLGAPAPAGAHTANGNGSGRLEIETPYLQLVMSALWAYEREHASPVLRLATLRKLGGAQEIVRAHLDGALALLSDAQRDTAVDVFQYLVTPSGAKVAYAASDLAELVNHPAEEVASLLGALAHGDTRILRHVPAPAGRGYPDDRYEIFHDVLAAPIRDWRARQTAGRQERRRKQAEAEARRQQSRARRFRAVSIASLALLAAAVVLTILALTERHAAIAQKQAAVKEKRVALTQKQAALAQKQTAQSLLLASDAETNLGGDASLSTLLALRALNIAPTALAGQALRDALTNLRALQVVQTDTGDVDSVAFSPDGSQIVTGGGGGSAEIWNARTGRLLLRLRAPDTIINDVVYSRDGSSIATAGFDGSVDIWNARTGAKAATFKVPVDPAGDDNIVSVAFSPSGSEVAASSYYRDTTRIWDWRTGTLLLTVHKAGGDVEFSPNGSKIVTVANDGSGRVRNAHTGVLLAMLKLHGYGARTAMFSPAGSEIVTTEAGSPTNFRPDGDAPNVASIWDSRTGALVRPLTLPHDFYLIYTAAFSPHGGTILTAGVGSDNVSWQLWDVRTGALLANFAASSGTDDTAAAFSPDGSRIVIANGGTAEIWSARPTVRMGVIEPHLRPLQDAAFAPGGLTFVTASSDGTARIWNTRTGALVTTFEEPGGAAVYTAAFDSDGSRIVTASNDGTARLWNARTGALLKTLKPCAAAWRRRMYCPEAVTSAAFGGPDGSEIVTVSPGQPGPVDVWNARNGALLRSLRVFSTLPNNAAAPLSPNGSWVMSSGLDPAQIRDVRTNRILMTLKLPAGVHPGTAMFSPDGSRIVTTDTDGSAQIWNWRTGNVQTSLPGSDFVTAAFSPDGSKIVTVGHAAKVQIWDAHTGAPLTTYPAPDDAGVASASFSPDDSTVITAGQDGTARIWSTALAGGLPTLERLAPSLVTRPLTPEERATYLAGMTGSNSQQGVAAQSSAESTRLSAAGARSVG